MHKAEQGLHGNRMCVLVYVAALTVPSVALAAPLVQARATRPSYMAYTAYRTAIRAKELISADLHNPRLLTDAQFAGKTAEGTALLGIYYGNEGWNMPQIEDLETWQGKKDALVSVVTDWCNTPTTIDNLFNQQLSNIWNNQNVPFITWEPYFCAQGREPPDVEVRAASGAYDGYLNAWAERLKQFLSGPDGVYDSADDRRVFIRFAHEMNGDWFQWGAAVGRNAPADYIRMWRRVKAIFDRKGIGPAHVQWIWCVNHTDNGPFTAEEYYPGDASVDWVGVDGYNWGQTQSWSTWKGPAETYTAMLNRLRKLTTKPIALPEYATTSVTAHGEDIASKSQWIGSVHRYVLANNVRLVVWFNHDKETDWAIFGGKNGDDRYVQPPFLQRLTPVQILAAGLLVVLVVVEGTYVARLIACAIGGRQAAGDSDRDL